MLNLLVMVPKKFYDKKILHRLRLNPKRNCSFVGFRVRVVFSVVGPYSSARQKGIIFFVGSKLSLV